MWCPCDAYWIVCICADFCMSIRFYTYNNFGNTDISILYLIMGKVPDSGKQGHRLGLQTVMFHGVVMAKKSRESTLPQQHYVLRHGPQVHWQRKPKVWLQHSDNSDAVQKVFSCKDQRDSGRNTMAKTRRIKRQGTHLTFCVEELFIINSPARRDWYLKPYSHLNNCLGMTAISCIC